MKGLGYLELAALIDRGCCVVYKLLQNLDVALEDMRPNRSPVSGLHCTDNFAAYSHDHRYIHANQLIQMKILMNFRIKERRVFEWNHQLSGIHNAGLNILQFSLRDIWSERMIGPTH